MRQLYTIALPSLADADRAFVERFRHLHDPHAALLPAHWTLAFGVHAVADDAYLAHVAAVARDAAPVRFVCRYAMLGSDGAAGQVYLVPDEGASGVARLHDRLYTGPLAPYLRLDLPYVPHVTIGTLADRAAAKRLCDGLNDAGLHVAGTVHTLAVGALADGRFDVLASYALGAGAAVHTSMGVTR